MLSKQAKFKKTYGIISPMSDQQKYCVRCGANIQIGQNFCTNCGTPQVSQMPQAQQAPQTPYTQQASQIPQMPTNIAQPKSNKNKVKLWLAICVDAHKLSSFAEFLLHKRERDGKRTWHY